MQMKEILEARKEHYAYHAMGRLVSAKKLTSEYINLDVKGRRMFTPVGGPSKK
jgi:hypothetical protein